MTAKMKRRLLNLTNLFVILGVIGASFGLVMLIMQTAMIGKFEAAIVFIVLLYLLFMGSDVICRRYLRTGSSQ